MDALDSLGRSIFHGVLQLGVGLAVGTLCDALFLRVPIHPTIEEPTDAVLCLIEVAGQLVINMAAAAFVFSRLVQLSESMRDPGNGVALLLALQASQPHWMDRVQRLAKYAHEMLGFVDPVDGAQALAVAGDRKYAKETQSATQRSLLPPGNE